MLDFTSMEQRLREGESAYLTSAKKGEMNPNFLNKQCQEVNIEGRGMKSTNILWTSYMDGP